MNTEQTSKNIFTYIQTLCVKFLQILLRSIKTHVDQIN